jgi:site-specific DNA recombinase
VAFKGEVLPGEQPAIVDRQLFDAVQFKLTQQVNNHKIARTRSEALLAGLIFDDRGNRMTPSHVRKRSIKYRYYLSSTLLQGQAQRSGSICGSNGTAWWAREDSNLQPDRYER